MNIKGYIKECVEEEMQRRVVRNIIKEEMRKLYNEGVFEKSEDKKDDNDNDSKEVQTALGQLNAILDKNPLIKKSQIAYKLHPGVDHDSARHMLDDQLKGEDPISTTDLNTAMDLIHNAGLNEAIDRAMKKVLG